MPVAPDEAAIDRADAKHDYDVSVRAELEIKLLHEKIDQLRELEVGRLTELLQKLEARFSSETAG